MKAFLKACAVFTALVLATPSHAADKLGMPPSKVNAVGEVQNFKGCAVSVAGQKLMLEVSGLGDSATTFLAGASCDLQRGNIVFGVFGEYGFGEQDIRIANAGGRIGITVNPFTLLYGTLALTMDGRDLKLDDSFLSAGVGVELYLGSKHWTTFLEGATTIKSFGDTAGADLHSIKLGLRYRY